MIYSRPFTHRFRPLCRISDLNLLFEGVLYLVAHENTASIDQVTHNICLFVCKKKTPHKIVSCVA